MVDPGDGDPVHPNLGAGLIRPGSVIILDPEIDGIGTVLVQGRVKMGFHPAVQDYRGRCGPLVEFDGSAICPLPSETDGITLGDPGFRHIDDLGTGPAVDGDCHGSLITPDAFVIQGLHGYHMGSVGQFPRAELALIAHIAIKGG